METTEKRELLIAFQRYCLNTQSESEIYDNDIDSFISTLPDEGGKVHEDVERIAKKYFNAGYKSTKQSNPNPQ